MSLLVIAALLIGGAMLIVLILWAAGAYLLRYHCTDVELVRELPWWPWCTCGQRLRPCTHGVPSNWHHVTSHRHRHDDGSLAQPR